MDAYPVYYVMILARRWVENLGRAHPEVEVEESELYPDGTISSL